MACRYRDVNMRLTPLLLLLLVASLATVSRSASVGDFPARCGVTSVEERCDPANSAANSACSAACHYSGCGAGQCVYLGSGGIGTPRGCHCLP